jgi:hypothetical protein
MAAAASVVATVGIPSAHAASIVFSDTYCGANVAVDGVYARGCWFNGRDDAGENVLWPGAKMRIPSPLTGTWSACEIRLAVFWKPASSSSYTRIHTGYGNCLDAVVSNSQTNSAFWFFDKGYPVTVQPRTCYYVMARWFGTYDNTAVGMGGSGPFSYSSTVCGPANGVATTDLSGVAGPDTPTVDLIPVE